MGDSHCECVVTPAEMEEFERLFDRWQASFPTCDQLRVGATGDLVSLSRAVLLWAGKVLETPQLEHRSKG